ncbi:hypothetical protein [Thioalkalivibrio sp. ALM2T]|uniref:hypothetical protein n=1 Tax=Thioalkalivibrio sp. ALM2T TaxID=1158184 RepID=UPI000361A560|nr:hypothetical protein [Thioalkalivibrio sp. ALM2T]
MKLFKLRYILMTSLCVLLLAASPLHANEHETAAEDDTTASEMEELRESWAETREEIQEESTGAGEATRSRTRDTLDAMDRELGRLGDNIREGWDDLSDATRERRERAYDGLVEERDRLAEWSSEMRERSSGAWGGIRDGAKDAWGGVRDGSRKAWGSVRDAFRGGDEPAGNASEPGVQD